LDTLISKKAGLATKASLSKEANLGELDPAPLEPGESEAVEPMFELIELMFFAYRDFVADADHLLENFSLGRAHHRVLHFVNRRPGLTVAQLLDILRITKQSLSRVLKDLLDRDYVVMLPGSKDRRQRQLFPTARGSALAVGVARLQSRRFARVFSGLADGAREEAMRFLLAMVDASERDKVVDLIAEANAPAFAGEGMDAQMEPRR
jgi:DNA-binding MarR family transcriptional regulator